MLPCQGKKTFEQHVYNPPNQGSIVLCLTVKFVGGDRVLKTYSNLPFIEPFYTVCRSNEMVLADQGGSALMFPLTTQPEAKTCHPRPESNFIFDYNLLWGLSAYPTFTKV
jgi:hypothetical protein